MIGEYIVSLQGTEIRVDVVDAESPETAAMQVGVEKEDPAGTVYVVQGRDRLEFPVTVTI